MERSTAPKNALPDISEDINRAKAHIVLEQYDEARRILAPLSYDAQALALLNRLRGKTGGTVNEVQAIVEAPAATTNVYNVYKRADIPMLALVIIGLNMGINALILLSMAAAYNSQMFPVVFIGLMCIYGLLIVWYYVMYRYFWWFLAGLWTLTTLLVLSIPFIGGLAPIFDDVWAWLTVNYPTLFQ